ncbi:MAG: hypothetical protein IKP61_05175 [Spirochaetales bacterium]|nr:hypothetical protein [Spirochaetales bacterium]
MKKRFIVLYIIVLILMICACNSSPESSQTPSTEPAPWHGGALDLNDPYYADGLNDYGLPDLSRYSADQIWDMFTHPENWTASVLNMADTTFDFAEEEEYSDPEIDEEYVFDLGEWHDYPSGSWTSGDEEYTEFDVDWSELDNSGEYDPSVLVLPEEYAFLVPGGIRSGDFVINDEDGLNISLNNRTSEEYAAVVQAAQSHGYTIDPETINMPMIGLQSFSAGNGTEIISIVYQNGNVMITFE